MAATQEEIQRAVSNKHKLIDAQIDYMMSLKPSKSEEIYKCNKTIWKLRLEIAKLEGRDITPKPVQDIPIIIELKRKI